MTKNQDLCWAWKDGLFSIIVSWVSVISSTPSVVSGVSVVTPVVTPGISIRVSLRVRSCFFSLTLGNGMNNTSGVSVVSVGSSVSHSRSGIDSGSIVMSISVVRAGVSVSVSIWLDSCVTLRLGLNDGGVGL